MIGTEILISLLVFILLALVIFGIYFFIGYRKERSELMRRIRNIGEEVRPEEEKNFLQIIKDHWVKSIGSLGNLIKPKKEEEISHLRMTFLKAGYRKENTAVTFYGIKTFLAFLFFVISLLMKMWMFKTMGSLQFIFVTIIMALIGFYLPNAWLYLKIANRKDKIQRGLPDALDLMVVCVEAGTGLDSAISRVGEEMRLSNKVLSEEFRILNLELRAGKQRHEALKNLALRTGLEDVSSLVTLLIQTERFGTSIAQALRIHSDSMRVRRYQKAEEIATKLPVKLIFPLILFIFPALLLVMLGPAFIGILRVLFPTLVGAR